MPNVLCLSGMMMMMMPNFLFMANKPSHLLMPLDADIKYSTNMNKYICLWPLKAIEYCSGAEHIKFCYLRIDFSAVLETIDKLIHSFI